MATVENIKKFVIIEFLKEQSTEIIPYSWILTNVNEVYYNLNINSHEVIMH